MSGRFCSQCGQRAVPPHPTTGELAGEAYNELVGWDGTVAETIRLLLRYPGELTRRLLEGQRHRYLSPVRLYLTCSVLYFLVVAMVPLPDVSGVDVGIGFDVGGADASTPGEAAFARAMTQGYARLAPSDQSAIDEVIAAQPRFFQPVLRAMAMDYTSFQRRVGETMSRALFVLVPVLALILGAFYRGRHFPEHLYFAIHFQAFVFLVLTLAALIQFSRVVPVIAAAQLVAALAILVYSVLSQRRVYGETWSATVFKALGVAVVYGLAWSTTTVLVMLLITR